MKEVVTAIAPDLKIAGFRKRRHCFNRSTGLGVVQVVSFQMPQYRVPPGWPVPPGVVNGSFTINIGVHVDALSDEIVQDGSALGWVNDYNCQVFERIGALLQGDDRDRRAVAPSSSLVDIWWSLAAAGLAADTARHALLERGMPWLERFRTRQAVVDQIKRDEQLVLEARRDLGDPSLVGRDADFDTRLREIAERLGNRP